MLANGVASGTGPDLTRYRGAVADLLLEIASHTGPEDLPAAVDRLLREVRHYQPGARNCAADLVAHIRIHLFALIDVMWWGSTRAFVQDCDLAGSADLVDLEPLRRRGSSISAIAARPGPCRCGRCARWTAGCGRTAPRALRACASPWSGRKR